MKLRNRDDGRVHFSDLRQMKQSPAHYKWHVEHPKEQTRPMLVGAVGDALLFGGRKIAVFEGATRRGKEWEAFRSLHSAREDRPASLICNESEYEDAKGAADAVRFDPVSGPIVTAKGAEFQRVMQWKDYGLECAAGIVGPSGRGGFDILGEGFVTDLKITNSADPRELDRQVWTMSWVQQLRFYVDGCRALGMGPMDARLICVESSPPHVVTVVEFSPEILDHAAKSIVAWTEKLKACEAADAWPGFVQEPYEMPLPDWAET